MRASVCLRFGFTAALAAGLVILTTGCGPDNAKGRVKGRVKFLDKYLNAGTVAFISKDGKRIGSSTIDLDGNYDVSDAPVGECIITVKVPSIPAGKKGTIMKPPPGVPEARMPGSAADDKEFVPATFDPSKIVQIPGRYADEKQSGLTFTVSKGEQTKDITLSP